MKRKLEIMRMCHQLAVESLSLFLISSVDVGPASMLVGNLVAGKRIAQAIGRELGVVEDQDLIRKVLPHRPNSTDFIYMRSSSGFSRVQHSFPAV